jgi:hypothetical protein
MMGNSLNFVLTYRSPSTREENTIELCNLLPGFEHNMVLIGDINMPDIDWETGRLEGQEPRASYKYKPSRRGAPPTGKFPNTH